MAMQVRREARPAGQGAAGTVVVLEKADGTARAEIAPAIGFNCYSWQIKQKNRTLSLLYADPLLFQGAKPTRSGIPVLFPFPNRIRDGRFEWGGREHQLPLNDPAMRNAIHGFACRRAWRIVDEGADAETAWVTGEFRGSVDAPECKELWPADYRIRLTIRIGEKSLRLSAVVKNPDSVPLPFGLGYHPYFQNPADGGEGPEDYQVSASPDRMWELKESLPTGEIIPVDARRDLRRPRRFTDLDVDDVLRAPPADAASPLQWRGSVWHAGNQTELRVETSADFADLVIFTPPHRKAICLEPYTCTTDAINLQQREVNAGLRVLAPGEEWRGDVVMRVMEMSVPPA